MNKRINDNKYFFRKAKENFSCQKGDRKNNTTIIFFIY